MPLRRLTRVTAWAVVSCIALVPVAPDQTYVVRPPANTAAPRQPAPAGKSESKTLLEVELLLDGDGAALRVHEWSRAFRDLGVSVRVRRGVAGDEAGVTEQPLGPLRQVRVLGKLDRSGRIVLPDRTFSPSETEKLGEWIRELQTCGAQGNPDGKPLWGLSKTQFGEIYEALGRTGVEAELAGEPLVPALTRMGLPEAYPVRLTADAREHLAGHGDAAVRKDVRGFTHGTALAMVLNDFGLGFRPLRTPGGSIEFVIDPLAKVEDAWPVGWDPEGPPGAVAPQLFEIVPVELDEVPLEDVLVAISEKAEIPVRIDHRLIEKHRIDLGAIRVSFKPKRTSWNLLLRAILNARRLSHQLRIDEQGRPFVWVSTLKIGEGGR